ncbi:MAG: (d)CMP kinase [Clostridia bacterium]
MENNNIVIGIEGLVGSGKTSLCRELLNMIPNSIILHGGNLYRGIVYALMNSGIDFQKIMKQNANTDKHLDIKQMMDMLKVTLEIKNNESIVCVNGLEINEENLQSDNTSMAVSTIAKNANISKFYEFARNLIETYKNRYNIIVSGRDLMNIYPKLDYHFFITASLDERVNRKMQQYSNEKISKEELRKHIEKRDKLQEETGYYKRYEKTIDVDVTDCKTAEESAKKVLEYIKFKN